MTHPVGRWWQTSRGAVAAWTVVPPEPSTSVVLMVPALGYESSSAHRTLRAAAESLAAQGHVVVRLDLPGTGDDTAPTGSARLDDLVSALVECVELARAAGATRVGLVGLRAGATIALEAASRTAVDALALWSLAAGRRHRRELSLMGVAVPDDVATGSGIAPGSVVIGGWLFGTALLDDLAAFDATAAQIPAGTPVLVLDRDDRPAQSDLADALADRGAEVTSISVAGHDLFLDRASEDAEVGTEAVTELTRWYAASVTGRAAEAAAAQGLPLLGTESVTIPSPGDRSVVEEMVVLGPHRLAGVLTRGESPSRDVLLLLNSGSDPHVGSGRAWVELARELAARGQDVVRLDFRSWGESPHLDSATGRPYDDHHGADTADAASALRERGYERVVLSGLCAGAWVALDLARRAPVDAVLALNAQLYWMPGDPIEALMSTTRERRRDEIADIRRRADLGEWDRADEAGDRPEAGRWLDELATREVPVALVFAEGDDGIEYLRDRLGRRVDELEGRGALHVREVAGIDHSMTRIWLRPAMWDAYAEDLGWLLARRR